jgi:DNA-binding GntR family transcriptional regulator
VLREAVRRSPALAGDPEHSLRDGIVLGLLPSQDELVIWVAASREAVNRALSQLGDLGCVSVDDRRTAVVNVEALRRYARY